LLIGCSGRHPRPNIVLIVLDTTRWDHISCYGYDKKTTPAIDALADEAVKYTRAITPSSWTLPSHASIFTGMLPTHHRAHFSFDENIDPESIDGPMFYSLHPKLPTLAEELKKGGYTTGGVIAAPLLAAQFGFGRGFDFYDDRLPTDKGFERDADEVSTLAIGWLNEFRAGGGDAPFFLFLNYFDAHSPYQPPAPWGNPEVSEDQYDLYSGKYNDILNGVRDLTDAERHLLLEQYDREIRFMDSEIGRLFEEMKRQGLFDSSVIIITSDHGETFGEHRLLEHGRALYEELLHVPLIVKYPSHDGRKGISERRVSTLSIGPTILKCAGISVSKTAHPATLEDDNQLLIAEIYRDISWIVAFGDRFERDQKAIYDGDLKWIWDSRGNHELYDVAKDAAEENNLRGSLPEKERDLEAALKPLIEESKQLSSLSTLELDKELKDRLRALGYVK
jgi:arylsulfatase A-like enzyme